VVGYAGLERGEGEGVDTPGLAVPVEAGGEFWRGEQVAGAEAGEAPELGEAADHDEAEEVTAVGEAVVGAIGELDERLVDHEYASWSGECGDGGGRVERAGRVVGVAEHDQIGVGGHGFGF